MLVLLYGFLGRFELQVGRGKNAQVQEGSEPGAAERMGNQATAVCYFPALSTPSQEDFATSDTAMPVCAFAVVPIVVTPVVGAWPVSPEIPPFLVRNGKD